MLEELQKRFAEIQSTPSKASITRLECDIATAIEELEKVLSAVQQVAEPVLLLPDAKVDAILENDPASLSTQLLAQLKQLRVDLQLFKPLGCLLSGDEEWLGWFTNNHLKKIAWKDFYKFIELRELTVAELDFISVHVSKGFLAHFLNTVFAHEEKFEFIVSCLEQHPEWAISSGFELAEFGWFLSLLVSNQHEKLAALFARLSDRAQQKLCCLLFVNNPYILQFLVSATKHLPNFNELAAAYAKPAHYAVLSAKGKKKIDRESYWGFSHPFMHLLRGLNVEDQQACINSLNEASLELFWEDLQKAENAYAASPLVEQVLAVLMRNAEANADKFGKAHVSDLLVRCASKEDYKLARQIFRKYSNEPALDKSCFLWLFANAVLADDVEILDILERKGADVWCYSALFESGGYLAKREAFLRYKTKFPVARDCYVELWIEALINNDEVLLQCIEQHVWGEDYIEKAFAENELSTKILLKYREVVKNFAETAYTLSKKIFLRYRTKMGFTAQDCIWLLDGALHSRDREILKFFASNGEEVITALPVGSLLMPAFFSAKNHRAFIYLCQQYYAENLRIILDILKEQQTYLAADFQVGIGLKILVLAIVSYRHALDAASDHAVQAACDELLNWLSITWQAKPCVAETSFWELRTAHHESLQNNQNLVELYEASYLVMLKLKQEDGDASNYEKLKIILAKFALQASLWLRPPFQRGASLSIYTSARALNNLGSEIARARGSSETTVPWSADLTKPPPLVRYAPVMSATPTGSPSFLKSVRAFFSGRTHTVDDAEEPSSTAPVSLPRPFSHSTP